jgi:shikimate dehydrogenase
MADPFDFSAPPDQYAVMGNPIAHSKSPRIHALFAQQTGQRIQYTAIQVDPGGLRQAVGNFQANGGKGLNITVPFKRDAFVLVDERAPRAESAGAVNTIVFLPDGRLRGDNTDGVGLLRDIRDNQRFAIKDKRVLVLGAGGAVRGVLEPLLGERPRELVVANRTVERALELESFRGVRGCGFDALIGKQFDLVINGTSASLQGELPPLPDTLLAAGSLCYDMMYGKQPTVFMQWAGTHGAAQVLDGLGMLVEQAAESFFLWRGVRPATAPVISRVRAAL